MASGSGAQYVPTGGEGKVPQWWGIYAAYIAVNQDPLDTGRVKLRVPQVFGNTTSGWASPMVPVSFIPKVGTPVTAMFVGGDPTQPVWFGNFSLGAGGTTTSGTSAPDPTPSPAPPIGSIYFQVNGSGQIQAMFEWNGAGWVDYFIAGSAITVGAQLAQPAINGGTITSATSLWYNGTPAAGNLVASISVAPGTDGFGNHYPAGVTAVISVPLSGGGHNTYTVELGDLSGMFGDFAALVFTNTTNPASSPAAVLAQSSSSGSAIQLNSGSAFGSGEAVIAIEDSAFSGVTNGAVNINAGQINASGATVIANLFEGQFSGAVNGVNLTTSGTIATPGSSFGSPATAFAGNSAEISYMTAVQSSYNQTVLAVNELVTLINSWV